MSKVYSKALDQSIELDRIIGHLKGNSPGPTLIFVAGIHGNEPSGVFALQKVFQCIEQQKINVKGNAFGLSGNLWALERGKRYHKEDLNRLWTASQIKELENEKPINYSEDAKEQRELYFAIKNIMASNQGPFYFMDLHTTSGETVPFLTVNDSILNRKFTKQYPLPMILGIEEYLSGPMLSYINELGYVSFGFEGGQHDELASVLNHEAFIYLSMVFTHLLSKNEIAFDRYYKQLIKATSGLSGIYEIYYRYEIKEKEQFTMKPGYKNFQFVSKGEELALSNNKKVMAAYSSRIFMPLYQSQGSDGFFAIKKVRRFSLQLSALLRKCHFDRLLPILPGVSWASAKRDSLIINKKIARFFAKEFIHLLGYRSKYFDKLQIIVKNREVASRKKDYRKEEWY